ncbi:hypothetical protein DSM112329_01053 [Paraconexibacter sp. AEG42_29]|uniref:PAC domain-containing protein n=1 Tax=Paraconexibacter sp. AEG42_29 TaxID=2997339 RepID=A0AAU7AS80_9ACTN
MTDPHAATRVAAERYDARRDERARIAAAIHDDALQRVLALRQDVEEVGGTLDAPAVAALHDAVRGIETALRHATAALDDGALDEVTLAEALTRVAADVNVRGRLAIDVSVDPAATGLHDIAIRDWVRELLRNVAKHASASRCAVAVTVRGDEVEVVVLDDGAGLDRAAVARAERDGHVGVARLRRAAEGLGGTLTLSSPGLGTHGTSAVVRVPCRGLQTEGELERLLSQERRWAGALLAALQDALIVIRDDVVVHVNDAFCALFGRSRAQLLQLDVVRMPWWPAAAAQEARALLERAAREPGLSAEFVIPRRDGRRTPVHVRLQRIDDPVAGTAGVVITIRDLTEQYAAAERERAEHELRSTIETARRLTGLQRAAANGTAAVLEVIGAILHQHLGWQNAVLNLRGDDGYEVVWDPRGVLTGARYAPAELEVFLDARFLRGGCWHVPEELSPNPSLEPTYTDPQLVPGTDPDAERPGDLLFVPLRTPEGTLLGLLSVDGAPGGRRPSDTMLEVLATIADHAATALLRAADRAV